MPRDIPIRKALRGRRCPGWTADADGCRGTMAGRRAGPFVLACMLVAVAGAQSRPPAKYISGNGPAVSRPSGSRRSGSPLEGEERETDSRGTPQLVRASGQISGSPDSLIVPSSVRPVQEPLPVYQTWYFYLALLFLGITLPAQFFRRRMMLMKGRIGIVLEERSRIASECHDTLMAGFAAISWQLEATAKLFRDSGLDATPAAESCELARSMVAHCQAEARRIIWDLRETDELTSVLSQSLARSLAANHVHGAMRTSLEVEGEEIPLAPGCVHHLTCIGQEAVTNAIRHSGASHIVVGLKYESEGLCLSIRDDGRGLQALDRAASKHGHFGIAVMQERTRKLGGAFRIQGSPDLGTEVMVRVPFNAMQQPVTQGQHVIRWIGI